MRRWINWLKQVLQKDTINIHISLGKSEIKVIIWNKSMEECQGRWNNETRGRFLYSFIKSTVRTIRKTRREEIICYRIKLDHSNVNSTLSKTGKNSTGLCEHCHSEDAPRKNSL